MAWDLTSMLVGGVAGFVLGAIVFTQFGRETTKTVVGATARRAARYIEPK